jgi:hypothetical protein
MNKDQLKKLMAAGFTLEEAIDLAENGGSATEGAVEVAIGKLSKSLKSEDILERLTKMEEKIDKLGQGQAVLAKTAIESRDSFGEMKKSMGEYMSKSVTEPKAALPDASGSEVPDKGVSGAAGEQPNEAQAIETMAKSLTSFKDKAIAAAGKTAMHGKSALFMSELQVAHSLPVMQSVCAKYGVVVD